jgi:hypothetical protein
MEKQAVATRANQQQQVGKPWVDNFGRERIPRATSIADDGTVTHGAGALGGIEAMCKARAEALDRIGPEGRARLDAAYAEWNQAIDNDPVIQAERDRARAARERGEPVKFDITARAEMLKRVAFERQGLTIRTPVSHAGVKLRLGSTGRAPREARNDHRRGSRRGGRATSSSSDDPDPEPEPAERRCENQRCSADVSHLHSLRRYCDDACQQQAYRDRHLVDQLETLAGTTTFRISCRCRPRGEFVVENICFACGRPRGPVTLKWERDPAPPARSFVNAHAPKRRNLRLGDRKRKPVTDEHGNRISVPKPEAVVA